MDWAETWVNSADQIIANADDESDLVFEGADVRAVFILFPAGLLPAIELSQLRLWE